MATEMSRRVGTRIRQAREEKGLNQGELAAKIPSTAINNQRISDWERGVNQPSSRYMEALAKALEREVGWFYTDPSDDGPGDLIGALNGKARAHERTQLERIEEQLAETNRMLSRVLELISPQDPAAETAEVLTEAALADDADAAAELAPRNGDASGARPASPRPRAPRRRKAS